MEKTRVIGYGSFLDEVSLSKTIKPRPARLVWVRGYRRIFNLKPSRMKLYHIGGEGIKVAVANIEPAEDAKVNGVVLDVDQDELQKLMIRQQSYRIKELPYYDYETGEVLGKAMVFIGNKIFRSQRIIEDYFLPIPSYLKMVRDAAYRISGKFGKDFDDTTYIADGTKLSDWLK